MPIHPEQTPFPDSDNKRPERPVVVLLNQMIRASSFWIGFSFVLVGLIVVCWGPEVFKRTYDIRANDVEEELKAQFELMLRKTLPEKLEWGREALRKRLPSRFPEELFLATKQKDAEAKYDNSQRTSAHYQIFIAYHFLDAPERTYLWNPVTFYFELRHGHWELAGDRWVTEWEVEFE
ncbi:hypothetical protein KAR10_07080 [bacterium]|nr:hypothetical protein [bacterium]